MPERELTPTRIALLELIDERRMVREGYELLDEKRMLLAARILRTLEALGGQREELGARWQTLVARLRNALAAHGLHDIEVWPPRSATLSLERRAESVLGILIGTATADLGVGANLWPPATDSAPVDACVEATRHWLAAVAAMAAREASVLRLADEYVRTERRARAVEQVLLPELETDLRGVEAALEALDQEGVVRVHSLRSVRA